MDNTEKVARQLHKQRETPEHWDELSQELRNKYLHYANLILEIAKEEYNVPPSGTIKPKGNLSSRLEGEQHGAR